MEQQSPLPRMRRDLKIQAFESAGETYLLATDPWSDDERTVTLSELSYLVLQLMDGHRTIRDLQRRLKYCTGGLCLSLPQIQGLVKHFTDLVLLEDEQYWEICGPVREAYIVSRSRPAAHAGFSYPEDREELEEYIERVLALSTWGAEALPPADSIRAVVSPHLDLRVEEEAYAMSYRSIEGLDPDRVILLGTGHDIVEGLFCLTHKDYETPLGAMPCDRDAVSVLRSAAPEVCSPDDLPHREEHALEFQIPFLQTVLARSDTPIVPILCGSFRDALPHHSKPSDIPAVADFVDALRSLITERTLLVAGVDFSHIGQKFGHGVPASSMLESVRRHDRALLNALVAGSLRDFWHEVQSVDNSYHVCGFGSLCVLLEALPHCKGQVLRHDFWSEEETESAVSFASVLLT